MILKWYQIDFIISNNSKLKCKNYPIEVKSSKKYSTASLDNFISEYKDRIDEAYIIHPKNLSFKEGGYLFTSLYDYLFIKSDKLSV